MRKIGVCSWSLRPTGAEALVQRLGDTGVRAVQLALDPLRTGDWPLEESLATLEAAGVQILSGMIATKGEDYTSLETIRVTGGLRPDKHWRENLRAAQENARLARRLGLGLVSFHAGFLPEVPSDPERKKLLLRLREYVDVFAECGLNVALETGQESAVTLADFLADLDHDMAGVNFDPANMILYDKGDPVEALALLAPWVRQVHVKDAVRTIQPGTWGSEVPAGTGEVDWDAFFDVLQALDVRVDLVIEREAGEARVQDIRTARILVESHLARFPSR